MIVEGLRAQPRQAQAVLASILIRGQNGGDGWRDTRLLSSSVYERYKKTVVGCGLKVLTQRRVFDLIGELETVGIIETIVISKGRYGRCREIKVLLNESGMLKARRVLAESGF
jgi:cell division control protein 6